MHRISTHTHWINFDKLAHITRFISDIVQRIDRTPADADHAPADPFDIEIRMLRKALGPVAITGLRAMGIKLPESRKDLDRLVTNLIDGKPLKRTAPAATKNQPTNPSQGRLPHRSRPFHFP